MKRIFFAFLIFLALNSMAFAENVDIEAMPLDELLKLRSRITSEINVRLSMSEGVFYPYEYKIGEEIPAGWYHITCMEILNDMPNGRVDVWAEGENVFSDHFYEYIKVGRSVFVKVVDGYTLRIDDCTVTIRPYSLPEL